MEQKRRSLYNLLVVMAIILVGLSFSPFLLVHGKIQPTLFKMPFALWTSISATILLVFFTYLGGKLRGSKGDFTSDK